MNNITLNAIGQNNTLMQDYRRQEEDQITIVSGVFLAFSVVGVIGNLIVLWYLCFKIQRNKYTVYIVNLSAADAVLEAVAIMTLMVNIYRYNSSDPYIEGKVTLILVFTIFYYAMIYTGMYLLTAISMERCASVLFPIWNTVRRPRNLSTIMCCFAWALGCLESLLDNFVCGVRPSKENISKCSGIGILNFVLSVGICLPLMIISSLILLIKIKKTFRQRYPPKLYIIIIVAAILFTLSVLPLNTVRFLIFCNYLEQNLLTVTISTPSEYWMIVNSAINPFVYFLIGRRWNQGSFFSLKDTLQRAFALDNAE